MTALLANPTGTFTIKWTSCFVCGCVVAMESGQYNRFLESHETFYCPSGHAQHFTGKTEAQKRAERAEAEAERLRNTANYYQREATVQRHRANAQKAAKSRLKNKIARGQCPCCQEEFRDLAGHMVKEHPKYGRAES
jgi:hypothetical protein